MSAKQEQRPKPGKVPHRHRFVDPKPSSYDPAYVVEHCKVEGCGKTRTRVGDGR